MLKSPDKNSRWVDWENLIYVRQNRNENHAGIDRGKRSKTLSEVKPVKNINKNLQFSRDKSRAKGSPSFT